MLVFYRFGGFLFSLFFFFWLVHLCRNYGLGNFGVCSWYILAHIVKVIVTLGKIRELFPLQHETWLLDFQNVYERERERKWNRDKERETDRDIQRERKRGMSVLLVLPNPLCGTRLTGNANHKVNRKHNLVNSTANQQELELVHPSRPSFSQSSSPSPVTLLLWRFGMVSLIAIKLYLRILNGSWWPTCWPLRLLKFLLTDTDVFPNWPYIINMHNTAPPPHLLLVDTENQCWGHPPY